MNARNIGSFLLTPLRYIFLLPVYLYSYLISPLLPSHCRYTPSCSRYTIEAVRVHGVIKGTLLGLFRITRCHAMFTGGPDPIPDQFSWQEIKQGFAKFRHKKHEK